MGLRADTGEKWQEVSQIVPESGIWFPQQLTDIYRIFETKTGKANWSKGNLIASDLNQI